MKIGLSLSRCVRDIFDGTVDMDDVLVIIARTNFDPENSKHWNSIWHGYAGNGSISVYSNPEWFDYQQHEQEFRDICIRLKLQGKLHQPRQYGANPKRLPYYWYDVVLTESIRDDNPAAKKAWDNYKLIAGLV